MNQRFLIIIAAADRDAANSLAKAQFDTAGGEKTFSVGLSASGAAPASHYWCSALFTGDGPEKLAAAQAVFPSAVVQTYDADGDPGFPGRTIASLGLKQVVNLPGGAPWL